jgi:hypothetical protein
MRAYVAPTDTAWFDFLSRQPGVDEVNFWMPRPWGGRFGVLRRGEPLLFKLKNPYNHIGGGGFFEHYTELPISLAWEAFGIKNGAPSLEAVRERIGRLRRERPGPWSDYTIGCILLVEPFFLPRARWIADPPGFSREIVRGKTYDLGTGDGRWIWDAVVERLQGPLRTGVAAEPPARPAATATLSSSHAASARAPSASWSPTPTPAAAPSPVRRRSPRSKPPTSAPSAWSRPTRSGTGSSSAPTCTVSSTSVTSR